MCIKCIRNLKFKSKIQSLIYPTVIDTSVKNTSGHNQDLGGSLENEKKFE